MSNNDSNDLDEFIDVTGAVPQPTDEYAEDCPEVHCTASQVDVCVASDRDDPTANAKMWASGGDDYFACETAVKTLPPGQYLVRHSESRGIYFSKKTVNLDELVTLPDNNTDRVLSSIAYFWKQEENFRKFGFLWKRGIMLWGPPGSGKTSAVQQLSKQIIEQGGISVYCSYPSLDADGLRVLRNIEPNRPIVVILEDVDAIIQRHGESDLLALLDGELQIDNVVFVATTNYPEKLDKRFINRPSRFDEIIKIGMPSLECRTAYLAAKNENLTPAEIDEWAANTDGFSIAHLRELIVSVECLGNDITESIDRLRKMSEIKVSSEHDSDGMGFMSK